MRVGGGTSREKQEIECRKVETTGQPPKPGTTGRHQLLLRAWEEIWEVILSKAAGMSHQSSVEAPCSPSASGLSRGSLSSSGPHPVSSSHHGPLTPSSLPRPVAWSLVPARWWACLLPSQRHKLLSRRAQRVPPWPQSSGDGIVFTSSPSSLGERGRLVGIVDGEIQGTGVGSQLDRRGDEGHNFPCDAEREQG